MKNQLVAQIQSQLSMLTRPCEVGLVIAVLGLPDSKAGLLRERLHDFAAKSSEISFQEDMPEKIPLIPYFKEGRIQLHYHMLNPSVEPDLRVRSLLRSCDGIILQLDNMDPSVMQPAKQILKRVLGIVLDRRRVAVFASSRTHPSRLEKSRLISGLDLLHTQDRKDRKLDSLNIFGPYAEEKDGYVDLLGWLGDLLEQKQYAHSCVVERVYIYDEAGLPVLLLETSSESPLLEPSLLTAMYRALEVLFFEQKGAVIKSLSLEGEEEQTLNLAAVRHKDLAALLFLRGPTSKTLIWQIGTCVLLGVKGALPKSIPGATETRTIQADSLLHPLRPHKWGQCDKCSALSLE
ncbi:MAG: hypothetical protein ACXAB4_02320 [Candidatus Hodarchaeales archaeon]|jgi:hypothetical protein